MNMIYVVMIIDLADFSAPIKRLAFKTQNAARKWGAFTVNELATKAYEENNDHLVHFDYEVQTINFVNN